MKNDKVKLHTCCFFGHRKIVVTDEIISKLNNVIEELIVEKDVAVFLFGSKSEFDELCLSIVSKLKKKYSHIRRIYVRAEFPYIDDIYKTYLLQTYEDTYYPENMINAGKAVYVERNYEMIDSSAFCVIYYDEIYSPPNNKKSKSGTRLAYDYAKRKGLTIINVLL